MAADVRGEDVLEGQKSRSQHRLAPKLLTAQAERSQRCKAVGAALVLEEQVEERGPARAKPHAKDEIGVVGLKLRIDEGILGGSSEERSSCATTAAGR